MCFFSGCRQSGASMLRCQSQHGIVVNGSGSPSSSQLAKLWNRGWNCHFLFLQNTHVDVDIPLYIYVNNIHTYAFTYSYIVLCTYTKINTCITIIFYICHYMHSYVYIDIYRYICYTLYFNKYTCLRRFSPSSNHSPLFLLVFQPLELPQSPFQERHRCLRSLCWAHRCPPAQSNDAMAEACGNGGRKQPYPSVCQRCHMSHTIHSPSSIHRKWKL